LVYTCKRGIKRWRFLYRQKDIMESAPFQKDRHIMDATTDEDQLEKSRHTHRILLIVTIVLVVLALGIGTTFGVIVYQRAHASCTIGVSGYAMTITVEGNGADAFCSNPAIGNGAIFYHYEGTPSGAEVCIGDHKRSDGSVLHYVVRDSAAFILLDTAVCNRLRSP
jgi:hypothetical protein